MAKKDQVDEVIDKVVSEEKDSASVLKHLLVPFDLGFKLIQKIAKRTEESIPMVYEQIETFIRSNLISIDGKKRDVEAITELISQNIMKKLPVDQIAWEKISRRKSDSYIQILDRVLSGEVEDKKDYTVLSKKNLFKKVLIANRGEIAIRIIRACRELGIKVVAVYTPNEKNSLVVKFANESYCIESKDAYQDVKAIIDIAKKAKVDAIHPGYGFLSEKAEFAALCEADKIKFIGPTAKTIKDMADKISARRIMKKAGVVIVPGVDQEIKDEEEALTFAEEMGFPIIIKPSRGGGGKGMRVAKVKEDLLEAYSAAKKEAQAVFGKDVVYIEKYIKQPRHIEFQILADKYGNVIHLGERDCTIQRRHQKLIEEAPSAALTKELREKMGDAAVKVAKTAKYEGVGTVEFLVDMYGNFYFMEMNTRIQVEHGITEMVTGLDLVKEQIKIASGGLLALEQKDVKVNGWAIECRINAEDPRKDFIASSGTISNYLPPGGPGIRVCSCSHVGYTVSSDYDSIISKLIVRGQDREEAITKMKSALSEYVIEGIATTVQFHMAVMDHPLYRSGSFDTGFIDKTNILETLYLERAKSAKTAAIIAAAVTHYQRRRRVECRGMVHKPDPWQLAGRFECFGVESEYENLPF